MNTQKVLLTDRGRIQSVQSLRAMAFLGIFTSHCQATSLGAWGVSVFIILSGFLMYYNYSDRNLCYGIENSMRFSINKIKKLYPLHIVMMCLSAIFIYKEICDNFSLDIILKSLCKMLLNIVLMQDWIPQSEVYFSFNGVAWYLSLCLFLYFVFPFVLHFLKRIESSKNIVIIIIIVYLLQNTFGYLSLFLNIPSIISDNFSKWFVYIFPFFRAGDFLIGCCLVDIYKRNCNNDRRRCYNIFFSSICEIMVLFIVIVVNFLYNYKIGSGGIEWFRYNMLYTIPSIFIIYIFVYKKGILTKIITNKVTIYLGNKSGYAFLIHQFVIRCFDWI